MVQRHMPSIRLYQVTPHPTETTLGILCTFSLATKKLLACTGQPHKHLTPEVDSQFVATNQACLVELGITVGLPVRAITRIGYMISCTLIGSRKTKTLPRTRKD